VTSLTENRAAYVSIIEQCQNALRTRSARGDVNTPGLLWTKRERVSKLVFHVGFAVGEPGDQRLAC
jgi:hypothetical protein